jgi:hypothetical protein
MCVWLTLTHPRTRGDQDVAGHHPTPSPVDAAPTPSPSGAPVVAGQAVIKLLPYDASVIAADPIVDLVYGEIKDGKNTWIGFTTETLLAQYPACRAGALGTLIRVKASPSPSPSPTPSPPPSRTPAVVKTPANQPFKKTVGGYAYSYRAPASNCASDQAGRNAVIAATAAVKNQALPTLTSTAPPSSSPSPSAGPGSSPSPSTR